MRRNSVSSLHDSALRKGSDGVRQPYPPRFFGYVSHGIKGCRWLIERAIETNNRNWLQRYRAYTISSRSPDALRHAV